jgi:hypothetical protein
MNVPMIILSNNNNNNNNNNTITPYRLLMRHVNEQQLWCYRDTPHQTAPFPQALPQILYSK